MNHLLERLGLGRPELRAWAMYDWANSAFQTTIIAAIFPIYFHNVVAADLGDGPSTSRFAWATTIAIVIVALVAPLLGAVADYAAMKKRMLGVFVAHRRRRHGGDVLHPRGDWQLALVLFVIGNIGVAGSIVFYESLLPHLVGEDELDRVSTAGYAIGYLGGGVLLAINMLMMSKPAWFCLPDAGTAVRLSLASVGGLVARVLDSALPPGAGAAAPDRGRRAAGANAARDGVRRLLETFRELRRYKQAFLLLLAFLIYNDGIQTIIRMATTLRQRDRDRRERDDRGAARSRSSSACRSRSSSACSPDDRRQDGGVRRPGGLRGHRHPRVLHDDGGAFLRARDHGRHGAGRHAGAQPVALRQHDPAAQVVGVLRVLRRLRTLRRHPRSAVFAAMVDATRTQPERDPVGARVLRHRCGHPDLRRRRRGRRAARQAETETV